jgi:soluble lytic murein transglycosylase-like protein
MHGMKATFFRSLTGLACLAFIVFPQNEGATADVWRPEAPDAGELAVLENLSNLLANNGSRLAHRLPSRVRKLISDRSQSFEIFLGFNGDEAQQEVLRELPYGEAIFQAAQRHKVDAFLLAAIVEAESNFVPTVISPVGAVGLAQVMPSTAQDYDLSDLENPATNLDLGARYLKDQLQLFDGNVELALAAYNAGPYAVKRHEGIPPFRETQRYVEKVLSIYVDHHQSLWQRSEARELLRI